MAMTKCKECGNEISTKADACPRCGAKRPKTGCLTWVVAGFLFLVFATIVSNLSNKSSTPGDDGRSTKVETATSPEDEAREKATSTAAAAAKALRDSMRNPDSFVVEQVLAMDSGAVCLQYRAQNGFGGMNRENAVVPPGADNLLTSNAPNFAKMWNKQCGGKTGSDVTQQVQMYLKLL